MTSPEYTRDKRSQGECPVSENKIAETLARTLRDLVDACVAEDEEATEQQRERITRATMEGMAVLAAYPWVAR